MYFSTVQLYETKAIKVQKMLQICRSGAAESFIACCTTAGLGKAKVEEQEIQAEVVETVEQEIQAEDTAQGV